MNQAESQMQVNTENNIESNSPNQPEIIPEIQSCTVTTSSKESTILESFESRVESSVTEQQVNDDSYIGQVKWFNNRLGYGFITIITPGEHLNDDIFVHQQHINPKSSDYRSLQQGEYVSFQLGSADSDNEVQKDGHPHQAISVTGVFGGTLLCDQIPRREGTSILSGRSSQNNPKRQRKFNAINDFSSNTGSDHRNSFRGEFRSNTRGYHVDENVNTGGWQKVGQRRLD